MTEHFLGYLGDEQTDKSKDTKRQRKLAKQKYNVNRTDLSVK